MNNEVILKNILHFDRENFGKIEVHHFRTLENCCRFQPPSFMNLDFRRTV